MGFAPKTREQGVPLRARPDLDGEGPARIPFPENGVDSAITNFAAVPESQSPSKPTAFPQPLWLRRVKLVGVVAICIWLGMTLVALPWTRWWTENSLLLSYPALASVLQRNFVRGVISGIGLIDVWLGVWEAVRYRESRA
jgi:hypothetical protein